MKLTVIFLILTFTASAQTITLPTWLADSLIFEAKLSRQCLTTVDTLQNQIAKQGAELLQTTTALRLSQMQTQTLEALLLNSKASNEADRKQAELDKKSLKQKVKKRNLVILGETLLIVILLL